MEYIEHRNEIYALLRDPLGVAPEAVIVPAPFIPILGWLDGTHSIDRIVPQASRFGVTERLVRSFLEQLDSFLLLDNSRSQDRLQRMKAEYRAEGIREASHAGLVYPDDPELLWKEIERFRNSVEHERSLLSGDTKVVGIIAPHIDYQRGWRTYGAMYRFLEELPRPDLIVLFGTSHYPGESLYQLTDKSFRTPFGVIPAHREIVHELARGYGLDRAFRDELLHRREHSLELQLPFLAARFRQESPPLILPILVGSFHRFLVHGRSPLEDQEVQDFVESLAGITRSLRLAGREVLFYGGVDLAHVGIHFGDPERMSDGRLEHIEERDRALLDVILRGDEEGLFTHIAEDLDARRICGFPSIYTMLAALRRAGVQLGGNLIEYRQAVNRETDCTVTFASAYWTVV